jgi:DnaK suppressor protein
VAAKTVKTSGKSVKQGTKTRGSAQPVRKSAAKPAKKATAPAHGKKAAKAPAKRVVKPSGKASAKAGKVAPKKAVAKASPKPAAKKAAKPAAKPVAKPVAKKAAADKVAPVKSKPVAQARVAPAAAPRHPQRTTAAAPPAAKGGARTKPAVAEEAPVAPVVARPASPTRPMPALKRPFSRESVRVGESKFAQPAGARPVFPAEFLERQRERLLVKKQEILAMYQKDLKSGQESNDSPTEDLVDRANNAYTRELAFSISDSERELMHQIDLAIERLNSGAYGFCLHTGQQIGQARLEAIPWAKYSVEAQELLEKGLLSEA